MLARIVQVGATKLSVIMTTAPLYTFGYEGLDIDDFLERVQSAGVESIIDVRELPLSRKRGFSKSAFRQSLANAGIAYIHVAALGCPKDIRDRYKADGNWIAYSRAFLDYLTSQGAAVRHVAALSNATVACLVCFEADYTACHRTYVARAVRNVGGPAVMHLTAGTILPDGGLRAAA